MIEEGGEQLWKLENLIYHGSLVEGLKAIDKIGSLSIQSNQNQYVTMSILSKAFQNSTNIIYRHYIIKHIEQYLPSYQNKIDDWQKIINFLTADIYSNYYKLRMTSLLAIKAVAPILNSQKLSIYHLAYDALLNAKCEMEIKISFETLEQLSKFGFEQTYLKKFLSLNVDLIQFYPFKKIYFLLCLLKKNSFKSQYQKSLSVCLINIQRFITKNIENSDFDIVRCIIQLFPISILIGCQQLTVLILEEIYFHQRILQILKDEEPLRIQRYLCVSLTQLSQISNIEIMSQPLKSRMISHIHNIRDYIRGIQNYKNITQIQKLVSRINKVLSVQIEVKQNIFILETKQYAQQSLMIDEFFTKLLRLFETNQEFQPDFVLNKFKTQFLDTGYQNLDSYFAETIVLLKKQNFEQQILFKLSQVIRFISYLLEQISLESLKNIGKNKKLQEQILFLNKIMNRYGIDLIKILVEKYQTFQIKLINDLFNQMIFLFYSINNSFYLIENRDLAIKDIVSERFFLSFQDFPKKISFKLLLDLCKISLYSGCFDQSIEYLSKIKRFTNPYYLDTMIDYYDCFHQIFYQDNFNDQYIYSLVQFQPKSKQNNFRLIIVQTIQLFRRTLRDIELREFSEISIQKLLNLRETLYQLFASIQFIYGEDYAIDCCQSMILFTEKILEYLQERFDLSYYKLDQNDRIKSNISLIRTLNLGVIQLLSQTITDLQRWISQALIFNVKVPKILLQIKPTPSIKIEINKTEKINQKDNISGMKIYFQITLSKFNQSQIKKCEVFLENTLSKENSDIIVSQSEQSYIFNKINYTISLVNMEIIFLVPHIGNYRLKSQAFIIYEKTVVIKDDVCFQVEFI